MDRQLTRINPKGWAKGFGLSVRRTYRSLEESNNKRLTRKATSASLSGNRAEVREFRYAARDFTLTIAESFRKL